MPAVALVLLATMVWWNIALIVQFGAGLMDRQRLEPSRIAYNTFVVVPRALPVLAWRYLVRSGQLLRIRATPCAGGEARRPASCRAHFVSGRHPISPRARQRHPDVRDVPRAGGSRSRGDDDRPPRHEPIRRAIRGRFTGRRAMRVSRSPSAPTIAGPVRGVRPICSACLPRIASRTDDVVLTRDLGMASIAVRLGRGMRPPVIYEAHGYAPAVSEELPRLLGQCRAARPSQAGALAARERRVWLRADGYVTLTAAHRDELAARFGPRRNAAVIPDGTRLDAARHVRAASSARDAGRRLRGPSLSMEGRGHVDRGAGRRCRPRGRSSSAGSPVKAMARDSTRWREHAASRRVPNSPAGSGRPMSRRSSCNATSSCLPNVRSTISERYTSPLKLFEYLAAGRPIVASNLPALREILTDGINALLVEPGNAAALAAALNALAHNPQLSDRLARRAFADAALYSWDARRRGSNRSWSRPGAVRDFSGSPRAGPLPGLSAASCRTRSASLVCSACGRRRVKGPGYLDLRPSMTFAEQTKYLDDALHADHRHETVSPPLLQAGVRQRMLRRFLRPVARRSDRRSRMRQRPIARVELRERRANGRHRRRAIFCRCRRSRAAIWCSATSGGCRLRTARSPRATRSTSSSICRAEALADVLGEIAPGDAAGRPRVRVLAREEELAARGRPSRA